MICFRFISPRFEPWPNLGWRAGLPGTQSVVQKMQSLVGARSYWTESQCNDDLVDHLTENRVRICSFKWCGLQIFCYGHVMGLGLDATPLDFASPVKRHSRSGSSHPAIKESGRIGWSGIWTSRWGGM